LLIKEKSNTSVLKNKIENQSKTASILVFIFLGKTRP
jgi:hypothetical protein